MHITNNKPCMIEPYYMPTINGLHDMREMMKQTFSPIFQPLISNQSVTITNAGSVLTEDDVITKFMECCQEFVNGPVENEMRTFLKDALMNYDDNNLLVQQLFVNQSTVTAGLPFVSPMVIYTAATDVIPISRQFISGQCDYHTYFATMANYIQDDLLGFYFVNEIAFEEFKKWALNEITTLNLPVSTNQKFSNFQKISLNNLTEAIRLRTSDSSGNEEYSFPRVLMYLMMKYKNIVSDTEYGVLPFCLGELFNPRNIVFINIEKHAKATASHIKKEWDEIKQALRLKVEIISSNQIQKLTSTIKQLNCLKGFNVMAGSKGVERVAKVKFGKSSPTQYDLTKRISRIMKKMITTNKTMNTFRKTCLTYNKCNRREPDDYNKPGKATSISYKPDIHLYVDTSGSISEKDYEDALKICINMAKRLNVNLYFNSFSHVISTCTKIHVRGRSITEIWAAFQKIDKVSGGTNFENVWEYINQSHTRKKELSIMITDFAAQIRNRSIECPKNLYYAPCSNQNWKELTRYAKEFCTSATHSDPTIRKRILF